MVAAFGYSLLGQGLDANSANFRQLKFALIRVIRVSTVKPCSFAVFRG
jgi:hypothetical protein